MYFSHLRFFRYKLLMRAGCGCFKQNYLKNQGFYQWDLNVNVKSLTGTFRCLHCFSQTFCPVRSETDVKKRKDGIIYYGSLTGQIKGVKIFTLVSSLGGVVVQPMLIQNAINGDNLPLAVALCSCVGFFTFVTPFLIHLFTKKYVTEIKYASATNTYTATTLSFFLQRVNVNFKLEDVSVPDWLPMFTTMCIKGKPVFVISDSFLEVEHYIKMMGYDKPIDLNLSTSESKSENEAKVTQ